MTTTQVPLRSEVQALLVEYCDAQELELPPNKVALILLKDTLERRLRAGGQRPKEESRGRAPLMVFPCTPGASKQPKEWPLYPHRLEELQRAFPHIDVLLVCRAARAWITANHPKTYDGMLRFLTSWLARDQNRAGSQAPQRRQVPYKAPESLDETVAAAAKARKEKL